jgi:hypothetical protein
VLVNEIPLASEDGCYPVLFLARYNVRRQYFQGAECNKIIGSNFLHLTVWCVLNRLDRDGYVARLNIDTDPLAFSIVGDVRPIE